MSESARENQAKLGQEGQRNPADHAGEPSTSLHVWEPAEGSPSHSGSFGVAARADDAGSAPGVCSQTGGEEAQRSSANGAESPPVSPGAVDGSANLAVSDDAPTIISKPSGSPGSSQNRATPAVNIRGRRLAHFELEEPIGVGGMAAVIRARDTQLDRVVALKILPPESAADADQVRRFEREARAAARLDHENIARVYYYGEDQGLHFIVFEYVEGENLRDMITRRGRIPVREATEYVLQVAQGLAHAADRGVVHRDIKPSNILITATGVAKLVDMGLARTLDPTAAELTQSGATLGTFDYISPEQALDPRLADSRSDLYSLGCTFYHMLTGRPPAPEGTAARKLHFHQSERPVDPRYYNPEIPRELVLILGRMLAKDPRKRYQHPRELIRDLQQLLQQWSSSRSRMDSLDRSGGRQPSVLTGGRRPTGQRSPGRLAWWVALVLVCGIAVASWLESTHGPGVSDMGSVPGPDDAASEPASARGPASTSVSESASGGAETAASAGVTSAAPDTQTVQGVEELQQAFANADSTGKPLLIYLGSSSYDLTQLAAPEGACLSLRRGQVILEPANGQSATLALDLTAEEVPHGPLAGLQLEGGIVTLRRVRLRLRLSPNAGPVTLFRVLRGQLNLENCEVIVEDLPGTGPASVFQITGEIGWTRTVALRRSSLVSSVPLFRLESVATVMLDNCGLTAAATPVIFQAAEATSSDSTGGSRLAQYKDAASPRAEDLAEGGSESPAGSSGENFSPSPSTDTKPPVAGKFSMEHCTWRLESGPALLVRGGSAWSWHVSRCVLAQARGERPTVMVDWRCPESRPEETRLDLHFSACAFYRVEPFVIRSAEPANATAAALPASPQVLLPQLRTWQGDSLQIREDRCVVLESPPWPETTNGSSPWPRDTEPGRKPPADRLQAFRVRPDVRELRVPDQPEVILGAYELLGQKLYPALPAPESLGTMNKTSVRELVVDGIGGKPGTFDTLSSAWNSAAAEDEKVVVILLKVNGPLPIRSLLDVVGNRQVTIRAADGFTPELMFHSERIPESNLISALLRVHDGQLVLEGLQLRLQPLATSNLRWQAAINLTGSGSCQLRGCKITLAGGEGEPNLAVVVVSDPTGSMAPAPGKPPRSGEPPQVLLENCYLRGKGVGVYVQESRPLRLSWQNVLALLHSPLLRVDTERTEMSGLSGEMSCFLDRLSVCSSESVVHLHAVKEHAQPVPLRCQVISSLFVTLTPTEPLIRVDGPQSESELRRYWLSWSGQLDKPNVYNLAGPALLWQSLDPQGMMARIPADRAEWCSFWATSSDEVRFLRELRWRSFRPGEKDFLEIEAGEFPPDLSILPPELRSVGADVSRLPGVRQSQLDPRRH